jgi:hypothetical protein
MVNLDGDLIMRILLVLLATTTLAACGGTGPTTVSGSAAPSGAVPTSAPTGTTSPHTFAKPTEKRSYSALGSVQHYAYTTDLRPINLVNNSKTQGQYNQFYAAEGSTTRSGGYDITYDPRDSVFEISLVASKSQVNDVLRFQDPLHRTDFGGAREPQSGVPNYEAQGFLQLQAGGNTSSVSPVYDRAQSDVFPIGPEGSGRDVSTFFYQKPGTVTQNVTLAGYVRNSTIIPEDDNVPYDYQNHTVERGVFAYGERTPINDVPTLGSASYTGPTLGSIVYNPLRDTDNNAASFFQWLTGSATTKVNFLAGTFTFDTTGTVGAPLFDIFTDRNYVLKEGSTFVAAGSGLIELVRSGGFVGQFSSASFTLPTGTVIPVTIAGSSIDGAFFGPKGVEVGGGFRIVGGNPDERIDLIGAFTGK